MYSITDNEEGDNMKEAEYDKMAMYWDEMADDAFMQIAHAKNEKEFEEMGIKDVNIIINKIKLYSDITKIDSILDVGCGIGRMAKEFAKLKITKRIVGVDVSPKMISKAKDYCQGLNMEFYANSGHDLSQFKDDEFDFVYSYIVFQHCPRKTTEEYLPEIVRVLKKGSIAFMQFGPLEGFRMKYKTEPSEPPNTNYRWIRYTSIPDREKLFSNLNVTIIENSEAGIIVIRKNE